MPRDAAPDPRVRRPRLDVAGFVRERCNANLELSVLAGERGLGNVIEVGRIQKFSLALTGFTRQIRPGRLQIIGETEILYCQGMSADQRREVFRTACLVPVCAFLVTKGLRPPDELLEQAEAAAVPVLWCPERSSMVIDTVQRYLEDRLATRMRIHGTLLEVYGVGVLIRGESGIGKSECALEMIQRGHRLVADDVVEVRQISSQLLVGACTEPVRHHLEVRGIGIINISDLFGVAAVRNRKRIELVVRLSEWQEGVEYDRLGLEERREEIMGVPVPCVNLPVASGRNLAILIEVAARLFMLKARGYHPARALVEQMDRGLLERAPVPASPLPPRREHEEEE